MSVEEEFKVQVPASDPSFKNFWPRLQPWTQQNTSFSK